MENKTHPQQRRYSLRLSILNDLLKEGTIDQEQCNRIKAETKEEFLSESSSLTDLVTPRSPGIPKRSADQFTSDFTEKLRSSKDHSQKKRISRNLKRVNQQISEEILVQRKKKYC